MNINTIDPHGSFLYSDSRLNVIVSAFNHNKSAPFLYPDGTPVWWNLGDILLSKPPKILLDLQNRIRNEQDEAVKKTLKNKAFGFTPSAFFGAPYGESKTGRTKENALHHTGLIAIDLDDQDNTGEVINFEDAINVLSKWPCVAYAGRSIRGKGFFALIAVPRHEAIEMHEARAAALIIDLAPHFNLDRSCKDITRLRYYSHTPAPDHYVNHYPENYERFYIAPPAPQRQPNRYTITTTGTERTGDAFNRTHSGVDVLTAHGWQIVSQRPRQTDLRRPGAKTSNHDATYYADNGKVKIWSTSAELPTDGEHTAFALFAFLEHGGDFTAAARALRAGGVV